MEIDPDRSKRDQAARILANLPETTRYYHGNSAREFVDLIIDTAKEEIRAELAEQAEEDRWWQMRRIIGMCDGPQSPQFWEEYRALKAKREAAGKKTE